MYAAVPAKQRVRLSPHQPELGSKGLLNAVLGALSGGSSHLKLRSQPAALSPSAHLAEAGTSKAIANQVLLSDPLAAMHHRAYMKLHLCPCGLPPAAAGCVSSISERSTHQGAVAAKTGSFFP